MIDSLVLICDFTLHLITDIHEQKKLLELQLHNGRISGPEMGRLIAPIQKEIEQFTDSIQGSLEKAKQIGSVASIVETRWPGAYAGWPHADGEKGYKTVTGIGPFRQGAGTRASYSFFQQFGTGNIISFTFYQTGATASTLSDLKQQIEKVMGEPMVAKDSPDSYNGWRPTLKYDDYGSSGWDVDLTLRGDKLVLDIEWAFDDSE